MSDAEYAEWTAANDAMPWPKVRAASPCMDCTAEFAASMRAINACNGRPGRSFLVDYSDDDPRVVRRRATWRAYSERNRERRREAWREASRRWRAKKAAA